MASGKQTGKEYQQRWGQLADTVFQHYTAEHGLPHGVVTAAAEDSQGFLWFGTQGGLVRWDGYRFHTYLPKTGDIHSLPDNFVQTLHVDHKAGYGLVRSVVA